MTGERKAWRLWRIAQFKMVIATVVGLAVICILFIAVCTDRVPSYVWCAAMLANLSIVTTLVSSIKRDYETWLEENT